MKDLPDEEKLYDEDIGKIIGILKDMRALLDVKDMRPLGELHSRTLKIEKIVKELRGSYSDMSEMAHDLLHYVVPLKMEMTRAERLGGKLDKAYLKEAVKGMLSFATDSFEPRPSDLYLEIVLPSLTYYGGRPLKRLEREGYVVFAAPNEISGRVIGNLIANAQKYGKSGGEIVLDYAGNEKYGTHGVSLTNETDDRVPASKTRSMFHGDRLVPEKEGIGMGLISTTRVLDKYGGEAWADSYVQYGKNFFKVTFTLPRYNE
jgi:signal transduction histidine kinase